MTEGDYTAALCMIQGVSCIVVVHVLDMNVWADLPRHEYCIIELVMSPLDDSEVATQYLQLVTL